MANLLKSMTNWSEINQNLVNDNFRSLARAISLVENDAIGYEDFLASLKINNEIPILGITGPPGAGKSTIVNSLISEYLAKGHKVAVIAIDPTSPFNFGSLLGDRIRMGEHFTNQNVFIRSIATRGSLGGLSAKTIEICDLIRAYPFDLIIVETVGVGQSEVEIVGLADTTIVVLVPEAGDEVQGIKSGIMEIADIFVVNKADREGADQFVNNLKIMLHDRPDTEKMTAVIKTIAIQKEGILELIDAISTHKNKRSASKKLYLLTEKAFKLVQSNRMKNFDKNAIKKDIEMAFEKPNFNFYELLKKYFN